MKLRLYVLLAIAAFVSCAPAQNAYITNSSDESVSVIITASNTVTATIPVGIGPSGVAVTPDGSKVYVANSASNTVAVINTATQYGDRYDPRRQLALRRGGDPGRQQGLCRERARQDHVGDRHGDQYGHRRPDPRRHWPHRRGGDPGRQQGLCRELLLQQRVGDRHGDNTVTATIPVDNNPSGVAVTPDGSKVYVANYFSATVSPTSNTVSVIDTATQYGDRRHRSPSALAPPAWR